MVDFERKLTMLAERGIPVGPEEMVERVEADLAGDPLVVVPKQRKGWGMSVKTDDKEERKPTSSARGVAWAAAVFVVVLGLAALYLAFGDDAEPDVVQPTPSTVPTETTVDGSEVLTDLEIVNAAKIAWFTGDYESVSELFEVPFPRPNGRPWTEQAIRDEVAYQATIGGELTGSCDSIGPGNFLCTGEYENDVTRAIGVVCCTDDTVNIRVEDGQIMRFPVPEHEFVLAEMGVYLDSIGKFDDYRATCWVQYDEACANLQLDNLDGFATWYPTIDSEDTVRAYYQAWTAGDCQTASLLDFDKWQYSPDTDCPDPRQDFAVALDAEVSVGECELNEGPDVLDDAIVCELSYDDARTEALGTGPIVVSMTFHEGPFLLSGFSAFDDDLRGSFSDWAVEQGLRDDYSAVCVGGSDCAAFVLEHLDDWVAWHNTSN